MGRHHPSEVRHNLTLRLAASERRLLERALRLKHPLTEARARFHTLGEFMREAACYVAHQVIAAAPAPADPRQVDLEDLIAQHGGGRTLPLRWKDSPGGVAVASSPVHAATGGEFVVKAERRRHGLTWWLELHRETPAKGRPRIQRLSKHGDKQAAMAAAEAKVRLALRTLPPVKLPRAAGGR